LEQELQIFLHWFTIFERDSKRSIEGLTQARQGPRIKCRLEYCLRIFRRRSEMLGSMVPVRKMIPRRFPGTLSRLENELDRYWDPFDRFFKGDDFEVAPQQVIPRANVAETDDLFEVTVELPGMKAEEVNVEFQNGALWITGEKKEEKEEKGKTFHRIERSYGSFRRMIDLPGVVKDDEINAEFSNGVLKIDIPKSEEVKPKHIKVKAN
jgi:HSP20 family protein